MRKIISGIASLDDNNNYIIGEQNLNKFLYYDINLQESIHIKVENNERTLANIEGDIYIGKDDSGAIDLLIDGYPLGLLLFNHTGEDLLVTINQ